MPTLLFSAVLHRAIEFAARAHLGQSRKKTDTPYIAHPAMVGVILARAGFDDETVAAGILHDVVEDTPVPLEKLQQEFGPRVADLVLWLSEEKRDGDGNERPWDVRKQEHYEKLLKAPVEAKAIALADKLHNLSSTLLDLQAGQPVWARFKAPRETWLWNAARMIEACDGEDPRLRALAAECRDVLAALT